MRRWIPGNPGTWYSSGDYHQPMYSYNSQGDYLGYRGRMAIPRIRGAHASAKSIGQAWLYWETYR